jgi:hypothetical protein
MMGSEEFIKEFNQIIEVLKLSERGNHQFLKNFSYIVAAFIGGLVMSSLNSVFNPSNSVVIMLIFLAAIGFVVKLSTTRESLWEEIDYHTQEYNKRKKQFISQEIKKRQYKRKG